MWNLHFYSTTYGLSQTLEKFIWVALSCSVNKYFGFHTKSFCLHFHFKLVFLCGTGPQEAATNCISELCGIPFSGRKNLCPWRKTILITVLCFLLVVMKLQARHYHLLLCQLLNGLSSFLSPSSLFCGQLLFFFNLQSLWIPCFQNGMSSAVTLLLESQVSLSFLFLFFFHLLCGVSSKLTMCSVFQEASFWCSLPHYS